VFGMVLQQQMHIVAQDDCIKHIIFLAFKIKMSVMGGRLGRRGSIKAHVAIFIKLILWL